MNESIASSIQWVLDSQGYIVILPQTKKAKNQPNKLTSTKEPKKEYMRANLLKLFSL